MRRFEFTLATSIFTGVAVIACIAVVYFHFFSPVARRTAIAKLAFLPLIHLDPIILDNGFGVSHVKFESDSKLSDKNSEELLVLNKVPDKYDLTLWLMNSNITDASIRILTQLKTTDAIILQGTGITEEGIAQLASNNPNLKIFTQDGPDHTIKWIQRIVPEAN